VLNDGSLCCDLAAAGEMHCESHLRAQQRQSKFGDSIMKAVQYHLPDGQCCGINVKKQRCKAKCKDPQQMGSCWYCDAHVDMFKKEVEELILLQKEDHDAVREDGHDAVREDGHDAVREDGHDAAREDGHEAAREDGHDAAREDGHDAAREEDYDAASEFLPADDPLDISDDGGSNSDDFDFVDCYGDSPMGDSDSDGETGWLQPSDHHPSGPASVSNALSSRYSTVRCQAVSKLTGSQCASMRIVNYSAIGQCWYCPAHDGSIRLDIYDEMVVTKPVFDAPDIDLDRCVEATGSILLFEEVAAPPMVPEETAIKVGGNLCWACACCWSCCNVFRHPSHAMYVLHI